MRVAFQLIAKRGLEGLRFADVARAAGINNGTLLYYFASKDALIQAVGQFLVRQFSESAISPEQSTDEIEEVRAEFADAQTRMGSDLGIVYTELVVRAQRDPAVATMLRNIDTQWCAYLTDMLERGRRTGLFRLDIDPLVAATLIMATIRGVGMQALIAGDARAVEPVMRAASDCIVRWVQA